MEGRQSIIIPKVWVNGTFDVLHVGHIRLLRYASTFGNVRVGLDSDDRIRTNKGESRPINKLDDRRDFMLSIRYVSEVVDFCNDDQLVSRIKEYSPDYFIIGSDYKGKNIIGSEYAKKIIYFERLNYSSTDIINKIQGINEEKNFSNR